MRTEHLLASVPGDDCFHSTLTRLGGISKTIQLRHREVQGLVQGHTASVQ